MPVNISSPAGGGSVLISADEGTPITIKSNGRISAADPISSHDLATKAYVDANGGGGGGGGGLNIVTVNKSVTVAGSDVTRTSLVELEDPSYHLYGLNLVVTPDSTPASYTLRLLNSTDDEILYSVGLQTGELYDATPWFKPFEDSFDQIDIEITNSDSSSFTFDVAFTLG